MMLTLAVTHHDSNKNWSLGISVLYSVNVTTESIILSIAFSGVARRGVWGVQTPPH